MAKRITELTSATVLAETDLLPVVDTSDTTQATSGTTKKSALSLIADYIADYIKARVETITNKTLSTGCTIDENVTLTEVFKKVYPIGTIYETTSTDLDTTTKMDAYFGGTWEAYGSGRVLVAKSADTEFDTIGKTGGANTHTLAVTEIPSHTHKISVGSSSDWNDFLAGSNSAFGINQSYKDTDTTYSVNESVGGGQAHNNLQPYIVVYRYRRTA